MSCLALVWPVKKHLVLHYFLNSIVLVSQCSHMCREAVEKVLIDPKGSESDLGDSLSPLRLLHNISFRDIMCFSQLKQMKNLINLYFTFLVHKNHIVFLAQNEWILTKGSVKIRLKVGVGLK